MFVKIGVFLSNLKVFLWNSYRTGAPQKIKTPRKVPKKWTFLSLAFYNAPSLHTVNKAKAEMRHFRLKDYRTRCAPVRRDRTKNPRHGQHPERDQNEIRICII